MWNKTKKYYHELKTLESIPVKNSNVDCQPFLRIDYV